MLIFPNIKRLKLKITPKSKKEKFNSFITTHYFKRLYRPNNNLPLMVSNSPTIIPNINGSYENNKNKYNNNNKSSTVFTSGKKKFLNRNSKNKINIIKYPTQKLQAEIEMSHNKIQFNNKLNNQKLFVTISEHFNKLSNIIYDKPKNINKFIEKINLFLLPNDKTFEYIQNLINKKIAINRETSKNDIIYQLLKSKRIPINTYNPGLIFKYAIKNTFKEALKKALLNKTLINKNDIKEKYQKQINNIKIYLSINARKKKDLTNIRKIEPFTINKYYIPLITNINSNIDSDKYYNKKMKLEKQGRNRKNMQNSNSSDNIYFNQGKYIKELLSNKIINIDCKKNEFDKNNTLTSLPANNNLYKESSETNIQKVRFKNKIDNLTENRLTKIIKKQKIINNDHIKLKSFIKKGEFNLTKKENSVQKNIRVFEFLSNNKKINRNKNEDIINYINNDERSIKFDNSLTVEKIDKSSLKRTLFDKKVDIRKILLNGVNRNKKATI